MSPCMLLFLHGVIVPLELLSWVLRVGVKLMQQFVVCFLGFITSWRDQCCNTSRVHYTTYASREYFDRRYKVWNVSVCFFFSLSFSSNPHILSTKELFSALRTSHFSTFPPQKRLYSRYLYGDSWSCKLQCLSKLMNTYPRARAHTLALVH